MRRIPFAAFSTVSFATLALAGLPSAAQAQENCDAITDQAQRDACLEAQAAPSAQDDEESIVVTGSRIARPNFDTLNPSVVVGAQQIESRGFVTLGEALNELPSFGDPGSSPIGDAQSAFGPGQSFVNFLGLGSQRTLTLVNGRRFVGSNTSSIFGPTSNGSQVDLNIIPTFLIDRVETIATGGAPIYGADAIAGTVNVILKRDFEGFMIDGSARISSRGDYDNQRIRGAFGFNFADGRGNLTVAGEYSRSGGLVFNDRRSTREGLQYGDPRDPNFPFVNRIYPDARLAILSEQGIPLPSDFVPLDPTEYPATIDSISTIFQGYGLPGAYSDYLAEYLLNGRTQISQAETLGFLFGYAPGFVNAQGQPLRFDQSGNLVPIDFGNPIVDAPQDITTFVSGGNGFQFSSVSNLITPLERYSAVALLNYDLTSNIRLFGEAWYSSSEGTNLISQPTYNTLLFGGDSGNIELSVDNPFLSQQARDIIQAQSNGSTFYLARANVDITPRTAAARTEVIRFVGGLDGTFELFNDQWRWEAVANYGRSETNGRNPELIQQNFLNAVDAVDEGVFNGGAPNGNIICRPGYTNSPFPTGSSTCAPLNLFGSGNASQAARDYVIGYSTPRSLNEQKDFVISASGSLFELPGGSVAIALGYEHREESQDFDPGPLLLGAADADPTTDDDGDGIPDNDRTSYTRDAVVLPVAGGYNTEELFGELRVPIVSPDMDVPLIHMLEAQGAVRYVDNSIAGGDLTWTAGGRYQPIRDLTLRGNYTVAIRAPAVTELFAPSSPVFNFINDPCEVSRIGGGPDPATRAANCASGGGDLPPLPPTFTSNSDNANRPGAFVGNLDLENEKARSFTIGAVFRPSFVPGLSLSVDYVRIRLRNAISALSASQIAANCYDAPDFPNNEYCGRIVRDTDPSSVTYQEITFVQTTNFNAARLDYGGILSELEYRTTAPFLGPEGGIRVGASYQYIDKLESQATSTSLPTIIRRLTGYAPHQAEARVNFTNSMFDFQISADYIGVARQSNNANPNIVEQNRIPAVVYFNTYLNLKVADRMEFRFIVNNLFDGDVPRNGILGGGIASYIQGVLGRTFTVGASFRF